MGSYILSCNSPKVQRDYICRPLGAVQRPYLFVTRSDLSTLQRIHAAPTMLRLPSVAATASSRRTLVSTSTNSASKALYPLRIRSAQCSRLHDCTKTRPIAPSPARLPYQQTRQEHAISNPTLANIEKRWTEMPPQEQAELWMALRDRMTVDWHQMTMQEKRACTCLISSFRS